MSILASAGKKFLAIILILLFPILMLAGWFTLIFGYGLMGVILILLSIFSIAAAFACWHH